MNNFDKVWCSFCGKSNAEVETIIAGPACFICNDCIDVCVNIIAEMRHEKELEQEERHD